MAMYPFETIDGRPHNRGILNSESRNKEVPLYTYDQYYGYDDLLCNVVDWCLQVRVNRSMI